MSAQHIADKIAKLNIKLIHGENLPTREGANLEPEYVCRLRISKPHPTPEHEIPRTHPVKGSVSPQFNQEFQLDVKNPPAAQMEILIWDVSPMTENPPGKEVFIGDVLVNVGKLIDYAGETIKWPFEIRKRTTAGIEAHGKLHTQIIFDQDCNVDLYTDQPFSAIQNKDMFGREVHGAFEEALKTKPDRIVLTGLDEWTENGVSKGTRCQIKMVPAPLQSADKRNIKTLKSEVLKIDMAQAKYPLNKTKDVKLDDVNMVLATPAPQPVIQQSPVAVKTAPQQFIPAKPAAPVASAKPAGMTPEEMAALGGTLSITVAQLAHLPKMDTFGKCDPVVKLELAGQALQTTKKEKVYDCSWADEAPLVFNIPPAQGSTMLSKDLTLKISVCDADKLTDSDVAGYVQVSALLLIERGQLQTPMFEEDRKTPCVGHDQAPTTISLTSKWVGNPAPVSRDIVVGPTPEELAAAEAARKAKEAAAAQAKRDAEAAEARRKQQLAWEQEEREVAAEAAKKEEEEKRKAALKAKAEQDAEIERLRLLREQEERERQRLAAQAAAKPTTPMSSDAVDGSGQWVKMRVEIAKSVNDLPTGRDGIERFRADVIADVAAAADVEAREVYFQEIDIATADPAKSIIVDLYVNGQTTDGAKAVVRKCTSGGAPSAALKASGRKIMGTAVGIKSELHYSGPSDMRAAPSDGKATVPTPASIPDSAAYNAANPSSTGVAPSGAVGASSSSTAAGIAQAPAPAAQAGLSSGYAGSSAPNGLSSAAPPNNLASASGAALTGMPASLNAAPPASSSAMTAPASGAFPAGATMKLSLSLRVAIYNMGDVKVFKDNMCSKVAEAARVDKSKVQVVGVEPEGEGMKCHMTVIGSQVSSEEIVSKIRA